ncbi:MAG: hypothetical protein WBW73_08275 [Rhodoplanes sp.]
MTSPLDPPSDGAVLDLPGLEADNLLGFLALLGLLRALEAARPGWRPRASWVNVPPDFNPGRPHARLHICEMGIGYEEIAEAVMDYRSSAASGLTEFTSKLNLVPKNIGTDESEEDDRKNKKTKLSPAERSALYRSMAISARSATQEASSKKENSDAAETRLSVVSSLARFVPCRDVKVGGYEPEETPLQLASGNMGFVATIRSLFADQYKTKKKKGADEGVAQGHILRSLAASWEFREKGASLRLSPEEDVRYAYRWNDPSPEGASDERGAAFLGVIGLLSLPLITAKNKFRLPGYAGDGALGTMSWPIWRSDVQLSHAAITALMADARLLQEKPDEKELATHGIVHVMRCRRFIQNSATGNYGNVSVAIDVLQ